MMAEGNKHPSAEDEKNPRGLAGAVLGWDLTLWYISA